MSEPSLPHKSFPLRLPISLRAKAVEMARKDDISVNHFISLAIAEKLARMPQPQVEELKTTA